MVTIILINSLYRIHLISHRTRNFLFRKRWLVLSKPHIRNRRFTQDRFFSSSRDTNHDLSASKASQMRTTSFLAVLRFCVNYRHFCAGIISIFLVFLVARLANGAIRHQVRLLGFLNGFLIHLVQS